MHGQSPIASSSWLVPAIVVPIVLVALLKVLPGLIRWLTEDGITVPLPSRPAERSGFIGPVGFLCGLPFLIYGLSWGREIFRYFHGDPSQYENPVGFIIGYSVWAGLFLYLPAAVLIGLPLEWLLFKIFRR